MQRRDLLKFSLLLGVSGLGGFSSAVRAIEAGVTGDAQPAAGLFTEPQRTTARLLADMIIPRTDTPGAVDAGVPGFIEAMYSEWYTDTERGIFLQGLNELDAFCLEQGQLSFNEAPAELRVAALQDQADKAAGYQGATSMLNPNLVDENTPFFTKVRELVVLGYYTSETGATQELIYLPVPGAYDGAYDFAKVGRQWTH